MTRAPNVARPGGYYGRGNKQAANPSKGLWVLNRDLCNVVVAEQQIARSQSAAV